MNAARVGTILRLELLQRTRSVAWYVLLGVFALLLLIVTSLAWMAMPPSADARDDSGGYSIVVYFVLLLVVLVSPTLSGNAINGDRDNATLAPVQVTLATAGDILVGKLLAAWVTGLAFVAVAVPFLLFTAFFGRVDPAVVGVSLLVLIVEVGVVAGIGVGLSGVLARPLFSVATTYLVVAGLVLGTLIGFGLGSTAIRTEVESRSRSLEPVVTEPARVPEECMSAQPGQTAPLPQCDDLWMTEPEYECGEWYTSTHVAPRPDAVWWMLAPNPFIILADATPTKFEAGNPVDMFGSIKVFVRGAQVPPEVATSYDGCADPTGTGAWPTQEERIAGTIPSWFVGIGLQLLLTGLLLWRAWARTRTPSRRLPPGTRIA